MNKKSKLVLCFLVLAANTSASAECRFTAEQPIICTYPKPAAIIFKRLGYKADQLESYERQLLKEAQCGSPLTSKSDLSKIRITTSGKVALPDGWAYVSYIVMDNGYNGYIANEYLSGTCDKYIAPTYNYQQQNK
ncbi:hypothetical protein NUH87_26830 [Pseudomonas batumici]|uniref:hypothetical protein n=1 Tax=Pseudomonas batumici TaxID=226910 RepID=UPI0030D3D04E